MTSRCLRLQSLVYLGPTRLQPRLVAPARGDQTSTGPTTPTTRAAALRDPTPELHTRKRVGGFS